MLGFQYTQATSGSLTLDLTGTLTYEATEPTGAQQLTVSGNTALSLVQLQANATLAAGSSVVLNANFDGITSPLSENYIGQVSAMQISGNSAVTAKGALSIEANVINAYGAGSSTATVEPQVFGLMVGTANAEESSLTGSQNLSVSANLTPASGLAAVDPTVGDAVTAVQVNKGDQLTWNGNIKLDSTVNLPTSAGTTLGEFFANATGIEINAGTINLNLEPTSNSYNTEINATSNQGAAVGIGINAQTDDKAAVNIGGSTLTINAVAAPGGITATSVPQASSFEGTQAVGISILGAGSLNVRSDKIVINANSTGNEAVASTAFGVYADLPAGDDKTNFTGANGGTLVLGSERTQSIEINATAGVSAAANSGSKTDAVFGIRAGSANVKVGGANTNTVINAGIEGTPGDDWNGTVVGVYVSPNKDLTTVDKVGVTLQGTGSINVDSVKSKNGTVTANSILVAAQEANNTASLDVDGTWEANGDVRLGSSSSTVAGNAEMTVTSGGLSVNGNMSILQGAESAKSSLAVNQGTLDVSETLTNAGTVTVGSTDEAGQATTGSLTAGNAINSGTFTVNNGSSAETTAGDVTTSAGTTYSFNNTGTLDVQGDLSVAGTLQNSTAQGKVTVAGGNLTADAIGNGSDGNISMSAGTLTVGDVENAGTFETTGGTLVVTGD
ncbi:MAG: hypothetical protein LUD38_10705, partial [Parabacteroides sp.]|nr:hypothetical protein [Parabacteroides sp.]